MKYLRIFPLTLVLAVAAYLAGGAVYLIRAEDVVLNFASDVEQFWTRIYYMFALSVLVERSVEVYLKLGGVDGGAKNQKTGFPNEPATTTALTVALALSAILAIVGIRVLETLVDVATAASDDKVFAQTLFFGTDVLISAGLMAGGSVVFHPLIKSLTLLFESMKAGAEQRVAVLEGRATTPAADPGEPAADLSTDERVDVALSTAAAGLSIGALDLIDPARAGASTLLAAHSDSVVFLSGRRTVAAQAEAMAGNVLLNRRWIEQTYAPSAQRAALQGWVDANPAAATKTDVAAGLAGVMADWSDAEKLKVSRHMAGLAFDLKSLTGTEGMAVRQTIAALPHLRRFLDKEGGLVRWHVEFETKDGT